MPKIPESDIPNHLKDLPRHKGYPVPFFVAEINGEPDFRAMDPEKRARCVRHRLCGICAEKIPKGTLCFMITGPTGAANRVHSDPPYCERCARFALRICPHIVMHPAKRRKHGLEGKGDIPAHDPGKAAFVVLFGAKRYKIKRSHKGYNVLQYTRPHVLEAYPYSDEGKLMVDQPKDLMKK